MEYFDEYDYFNFGSGYDKMTGSLTGHAKHKNFRVNTCRYSPSGNVRVVVKKLQNSERKKKEKKLRRSSV